jgi:thymidine phosphorylase
LISSGKVLERFRQMVELHGGDTRVLDDPKRLPQTQDSMQVLSRSAGYISSMQCEHIGTACVILGGGRERKEDSVDPSVGIVLHKKIGEHVEAKEPIATIYHNSGAKAERAKQLISESVAVAEAPPATKRPLIHRIINKSGEQS